MLSTSTAALSTSTRAGINPAQRILTTGDERQSPSPSPLSCSQTSPAQSRSPQSVPICVHPWLKNQHLSNRSITDFKPNQTMSPFAGRLSAAPCQRRFWSVSSTSTAALSTTKSCQGCGNGAIILLSPSWSLQKQQPTFTPPQCIATARRKPQRKTTCERIHRWMAPVSRNSEPAIPVPLPDSFHRVGIERLISTDNRHRFDNRLHDQ